MKIKKLMVSVLTMAMVAASSVSAFAASGVSADEQKILDKLTAGVEVEGKTVKVPSSYLAQAQKYLEANDVTADQVSKIDAQIDAAYDVVKTSKATDIKSLTADAKDKIIADAKAACEVVGVTLTVDTKNGTVEAKDKDGKVVLSGTFSAASSTTPVAGSNTPAAQTASSTNTGVIKATGLGVDATVAVAVALIAGVVVCGVVANKKKLFA